MPITLADVTIIGGIVISMGYPGNPTGIIGFGVNSANGVLGFTNLISTTGIMGSDRTAVTTARWGLAACGYGFDKCIFGYGNLNGSYSNGINLVTNTGVIAASVTGAGTNRFDLAAATYGGDKGIFGFGDNGGTQQGMTNLVSNAGVVATDTAAVGTARAGLGGLGYGIDKAIFAYGLTSSNYTSISNLVSNAGVVATDTTGVGTVRTGVAGCAYGGDKGLFAFGTTTFTGVGPYSLTNLVSNLGVIATDTAGVSATPRAYTAACIFGGDRAIFANGEPSQSTYTTTSNLVSNTGVMATDITTAGTARSRAAGAGYGR